uniref:Prohormone-4 n=1 Tax=Steinernema glaseri TaxID=37863 RepID=A0A1I7Z100_9BILA
MAFSLDLKVPTFLDSTKLSGREFQTDTVALEKKSLNLLVFLVTGISSISKPDKKQLAMVYCYYTRRPHRFFFPMSSQIQLLVALLLLCSVALGSAFSIREIIKGGKRNDESAPGPCPTWHPFQCPNGDCIPIKYLCDGSPDCSDEYDENQSMCTAATRPPVEETASFLKALLNAHGKDFLVKLFGPKARNELQGMGGVDQVAVALSQSPTIETFAKEMKLTEEETARLAEILDAIVSGSTSELTANEAADFRFFVQKLQETGFF